MERLTGLDAGFLYMETPTLHMHTLKIAVVEHRDPAAYSYGRFREVLASCLHLIPAFRRRVVDVPLGLDHPVWIEDPDFDLDRHVARVVLAAPGSPRQLAEVVSEIAGRQLDRSRPLWEIAAVEGLEQGRVAFVVKIHHCVADGTAASDMLSNVLRADGSDPSAEGPAPHWEPDPVPSTRELLASAARSIAERARSLPALLQSTGAGVAAVVRHARENAVAAPVPFRTPVTPFNAALTPHRSYAALTVPLGTLKAIKARAGTTLNDVFLAMCAGALRRYLLDEGALPDRALIASVPANSAPGAERRLGGNRVSNLFASVPVHLSDPVARLSAIQVVMRDAKMRHLAMGADMMERWIEFTVPKAHAAVVRSWSRLKMSDRTPPPLNLVASNVPGPREPLSIGDARLVSIHSIGPILEGIGLNVTAWSYVDSLHVAVLACPEHIPDIWALADHFQPALDELDAATRATAVAGET